MLSIRNNDFIIVDVNNSACDIHGYRRDELIGKSIGFPDDPETLIQLSEKAEVLKKWLPLLVEGKPMRK